VLKHLVDKRNKTEEETPASCYQDLAVQLTYLSFDAIDSCS
jgi:hypothetical protein